MLSHALPALNAAASADEVFSCRVTMCDTEWQAMRCAWDELYAASPTASAALDFAWLQTWWTAYSASFDAAELRIITVWCTDRMIGALPLYTCLTRCGPFALRRLCLMSTGEAEFEETCADYLNVLIVPREEAACMDAIWRAIDQIDWHHLQFQDLPEDTPLLNPRSAPHRIRVHQRGQCLIADLTGGFEAIIDMAATYGPLAINRAYCNWQYFGRYRDVLLHNTMELVQLFPPGASAKNGADIRLCLDAMDDLGRWSHIETVVVVSGDSDFMAISQKIKALGRRVIGLGARSTTNPHWVTSCHEFHFYDDLICP